MEYIILSNHFRLGELLRSVTAEKEKINEQFSPSAKIVNNLSLLCINVLDKVLDEFPDMVITSGYRCPTLNRLVGGVSNSQHMLGEAADIVCHDNDALFRFMKCLKFDQLIRYSSHIHVSYSKAYNREEIIDLIQRS